VQAAQRVRLAASRRSTAAKAAGLECVLLPPRRAGPPSSQRSARRAAPSGRYLLPPRGQLLLKVGRFRLGVRVVLVLSTSSCCWKSLVVLLAALLCSSKPGAAAMMMVGRPARRGDGQGGAGARRCALPARVWLTASRCGLRVWRRDHRDSIVGRPEGAQPPNTAGGNTTRGETAHAGKPTRQQRARQQGQRGPSRRGNPGGGARKGAGGGCA